MIGRPNRVRRDKAYSFSLGVVSAGAGATAPMRNLAEAFGGQRDCVSTLDPTSQKRGWLHLAPTYLT